ncbi:hypothetical protein BKA81DRAFT_372382 [Phyllosticta paracitricarpa]
MSRRKSTRPDDPSPSLMRDRQRPADAIFLSLNGHHFMGQFDRRARRENWADNWLRADSTDRTCRVELLTPRLVPCLNPGYLDSIEPEKKTRHISSPLRFDCARVGGACRNCRRRIWSPRKREATASTDTKTSPYSARQTRRWTLPVFSFPNLVRCTEEKVPCLSPSPCTPVIMCELDGPS